MSDGGVTVTTVVGTGQRSSEDGIGTSAAIHAPFDICRQPIDGSIILCDTGSDRIRRFSPDNTQRRMVVAQTVSGVLASWLVTPLIVMIVEYFTVLMDGMAMVMAMACHPVPSPHPVSRTPCFDVTALKLSSLLLFVSPSVLFGSVLFDTGTGVFRFSGNGRWQQVRVFRRRRPPVMSVLSALGVL